MRYKLIIMGWIWYTDSIDTDRDYINLAETIDDELTKCHQKHLTRDEILQINKQLEKYKWL